MLSIDALLCGADGTAGVAATTFVSFCLPIFVNWLRMKLRKTELTPSRWGLMSMPGLRFCLMMGKDEELLVRPRFTQYMI